MPTTATATAQYAPINVAPLPILSYSTNVVTELGYTVPTGQLLLGLEWEMLGRTNLASLQGHLGHVQHRNPVFIAKRDASVAAGLELVTLPLSYAQHEAWLGTFTERYTRTSTSCGVHIHITRSVLSTACQLNIMNLVHGTRNVAMQQLLTYVAGRGNVHYAHRTGQYYTQVANRYNYEAVCASYLHPTLELRIFAGTAQVSVVKSYLQFTLAMVGYCSTEDANVTEPTGLLAYIAAGNYPELQARLAARNAVVPAAPISTYTANVAEPSAYTMLLSEIETPVSAGGAYYAQASRRATQRTTATQGVRINRSTQNRERRTRSVVPTTAAVRTYLANYYGEASVETVAVAMRASRRGASAQAFAAWYAANCYNGSTQAQIVTATGNVVTGARAIATHAFYHLRLVAHV